MANINKLVTKLIFRFAYKQKTVIYIMHICGLFQLSLVLSSLIFYAATLREICPRWYNDSNTPRCIADDKISDVKGREDCAAMKNCCIGRRGVCYAMPYGNEIDIGPDKSDDEMFLDAKDIVRGMFRAGQRLLNVGSFDSLSLPYGGEDPYPGFPKLPIFVCQKRPNFPDNCDISNKKNVRYTRSPPLNIPYCLRIPCDPDRPELESKQSACRDTPGCYFDKELNNHRQRFGHSVMPGVPVCHLAIRNEIFLEEARMVKKKTGSWSPYLTECLLDTFDQVLRTPKEGCKLLGMLKYFKHKPKIAGWKGIKEYECILLDGCWMKEETACYYPVDIDKLTVQSSPTTQEVKMPSALYYGRPPCQTFNDKTPKSSIESYHTCLISGCRLDQHAQNSYYNYLYDFGQSMSQSDHWVFWRMVESGKYGAHNIDEYDPLPRQDVTITPFSLVVSYSENSAGSSIIDEIKGEGSASLLEMLKSSSGINIPPDHDSSENPFFQELQGIQAPCSETFTSFGGRPCGPPRYKPNNTPDHCPYKPLNNKDLKPLKGSFQGCCDVTLCYHDKEDLRNPKSGATAYYSIWSYWTECSATCGKGTKKRWRKCVGIDKSECKGKTTEEVSCEIQPCSSWGEWSGWTRCPVTCIGGVISRTRNCNPEGSFCPGSREEVRECNTGSCTSQGRAEFGPWSAWRGSCVPCGNTIYRSRECKSGQCSDNNLFESRRCPAVCGTWTAWSDFGPCSYDFFQQICRRSRTRICIDSNNRQAECQGPSFDHRNCIC